MTMSKLKLEIEVCLNTDEDAPKADFNILKKKVNLI
jgi:hypothetical protein